ncbi:RNA dependent RNA polymerase [Paenibacillus sp. FSL R10-2748]|uniref:RNA dependent RNA polymerase n=1 Tax=Paenibacillus sp. FSL R10-2748 TaxID=2954658 RepID=UPI0030F96D99
MSSNPTRNQYQIKLFHFNEITIAGDQLCAPQSSTRTITVSNSIYLDQLKRVVAERDPSSDATEVIFMLKADQIDEDDPSQLALYERMLREGIYYNGRKYVRSIKSPAMGRTQRTEFIQEKYVADLYRRITLRKMPPLTNIHKWEAALGVSRSAAQPVPYIPRIVVIPDYEKDTIIEDVWKVEKCAEDLDHQKLIFDEKAKQREYFKTKKELKPSKAQLHKLERIPNKTISWNGLTKSVPDPKEYKTFNGWNKQNRRVKLEAIPYPARSVMYNDELYPCYSIEQTEEIPIITINEQSIGFKRVEYPQYENKNVQFFDGQGLMSFQFAERIGQRLNLSYSPNAVQGRLPYIKGNFIRFDLMKWFKENNVTEIKDVFGELQPVIDERGRPIDLILTKSCFKAWHQYSEGEAKPKCLFENIAEYEELLKVHNHNFWVANYAKPAYQMNAYTPLTYQYIHALNLTLNDLFQLATPQMDVIKRVLHGQKNDTHGKWLRDIAYTKAFLHMLVQEDDEPKDVDGEPDEQEYEIERGQKKEFINEIIQAIDLNELMLYDGKVRKFIVKQAMLKVQDMLKGRIPIRGSYFYLTNDPIAFMQYASGKAVTGVLKKKQAFMNRKRGMHALFRSPLTIFNEVGKLDFVQVHNRYIRHLDNVIVLNCCDLTLARLGLGDVDGDTALCTNDPTILSAVIDAPTIINEDDKKVAAPVPNNMDSIVKMELKSLHNLTGRCTNVNTYFQNLALEEGSLQARVLENSVLKFLQGQIIDATKNGLEVEIPYVLDRLAIQMPYFFRFAKGGKAEDYQLSTKSPFNQFCVVAEKYIDDKFQLKDGKLDQSILGIESTRQLLQDMSKVSQRKFLDYLARIEPLYTEYNEQKTPIDYRRMQFNELKKWQRDNDTRKAISAEYARLREEYKTQCEEICPYPSILASVAVEIAYQTNRTYSFAWLFVDGLLENLKQHENVLKREVRKVNRLTNRNVEGKELTVQVGIATIDDLEFPFHVPDGIYSLFEIMGQFFIGYEAERETVVQTSNTPSLLDEKSTRRTLRNYSLGFSTLKKSEEESQLIADQVLGKKLWVQVVEYGYVHIVDEQGKVKCIIPRDQVIRRDEGLSFLDFDGATIKFIRIEKVTKSSFKAIVHIE